MQDPTSQVLEYVRREYLEKGDDRPLEPSTPLLSSGIVDSFSMVSLRLFVEKEFSVRIPDELATPDAFETAERIAQLVSSLKSGRRA